MLKKGQKVYYARIMPSIGVYEILELKLRTVTDEYFVGTENREKHAYLFGYSTLGKSIFNDWQEALKVVKEAEKNKKEISKEVYYEEF